MDANAAPGTDGALGIAPNRERTAIVAISTREIESSDLCAVFEIWNEQRGTRSMPARDDLLPRRLARWLSHISLVRVLTETNDYEFRIVGQAHVQVYGANSQGAKLSQVTAASPQLGGMLKASYDGVRVQRAPSAYRGVIGRDITRAQFDWVETLYLPLGAREGVDHILNVSCYGLPPSAKSLQVLPE